MAWQTPRTNYKATDYLNYADYNRIVGNLDYLKTEISAFINDVDGYVQLDTNKNVNSILLSEEMNSIENNLEALNLTSYNLNIGIKASYTINGSTPLYSEFNRIESACALIKERVDSQKTNNTAPIIKITSEYGNWADSNKYTVTGTITDNGNGIGGATLFYYDSTNKKVSKALALNNGAFSTTITLNPGINNFSVRAVDVDNNPSMFSFIKKCDNIKPTINVTSATTPTTATSYTLKGNVVDNESGIKSVTINGTDVMLEDNSFTVNYPLTLGTNTFTIKATDNTDNVATQTVSVKRLSTAGQSAPLSVLVATSKTADGSFADEGTRIRRETSVHYDGMGVSTSCWVRYIGYIDLTKLPDYQYIKKVVIQHPRYAEDGRDGGKREWRDTTTTHIVNKGDTKVEFNDYDYRHNDSNGANLGADIWARAWAGVRYITYYYVD